MSSDLPFGSGDPPPPELFAAIWRRHGHRCPMSTLGGRLGHAARRRLGVSQLQGRYRINTCAVDGIVVATGCSPADGTLTVADEGRHQLLLAAAGSPGIAVAIRPEVLERAAVYRRCDDALERERPTLDAATLQRRLAEREEVLDALLTYLCGAGEGELLKIEMEGGVHA